MNVRQLSESKGLTTRKIAASQQKIMNKWELIFIWWASWVTVLQNSLFADWVVSFQISPLTQLLI